MSLCKDVKLRVDVIKCGHYESQKPHIGVNAM